MSTNRARATILITSMLLAVSLGACPKSSDPDPKRPAASDGKYTIKFHRPLKVGDRFRYTTHNTETKRMEINGRPLPTEEAKFVFESVVTIKAVNAQGKATSEEHRVIQCSAAKKGLPAVPLAKDTVVLAQVVDGKEVFSVNGKPVAPPVASFLAEVLDLATKDSDINDDDVMGPGEPKKPGDSWNLNGEKMLSRMAPMFKGAVLMPKASDITGTVRFVRLLKEKGVDGMELVMKATINNFAPDIRPVKATSGSIRVQMQGWMPLDQQSNVGFHTANMNMRVAGTVTKNGQTANIGLDLSSVRYRKRDTLN